LTSVINVPAIRKKKSLKIVYSNFLERTDGHTDTEAATLGENIGLIFCRFLLPTPTRYTRHHHPVL